jgi:hypothetical protein
MKKKNLTKLTLNRETIRGLGKGEAGAVVGMGVSDTSCNCFINTGCNCASRGGTDCYPPSACFGTCSC